MVIKLEVTSILLKTLLMICEPLTDAKVINFFQNKLLFVKNFTMFYKRISGIKLKC